MLDENPMDKLEMNAVAMFSRKHISKTFEMLKNPSYRFQKLNRDPEVAIACLTWMWSEPKCLA